MFECGVSGIRTPYGPYGILFGVRFLLARVVTAVQVGEVPRGTAARKEGEEIEVATSVPKHPDTKTVIGVGGADHP